ncbi:MAG: hypothetical protein HY897_01830 [Deltaproteobacteria bacterium]|nr:hypothetical protein [Deltaproteobacteria bacterium]
MKSGESADLLPSNELSALSTLLSNWRSVVEEGALLPDERRDKKSGQQRLKLGE